MYNPFFSSPALSILSVILIIWTVVWKIYAVWIAVKNNQKKWFLAIMILNTVSILEIFYVFKVAKKSWAEVKADFNRKPSEILKEEKV